LPPSWRTNNKYFFYRGATAPSAPRPPHCRGYMITLRHTALGRTPLAEWSARHRDLYLTTHNTHKRQTSMPLAGFEPIIPASDRPQTHAFRPRGYWERQWRIFSKNNLLNVVNIYQQATSQGALIFTDNHVITSNLVQWIVNKHTSSRLNAPSSLATACEYMKTSTSDFQFSFIGVTCCSWELRFWGGKGKNRDDWSENRSASTHMRYMIATSL
jgi:hypothetical protein